MLLGRYQDFLVGISHVKKTSAGFERVYLGNGREATDFHISVSWMSGSQHFGFWPPKIHIRVSQ